MSFARAGLDYEVFAARGPRRLRTGIEAPLSGLHSLSKTKPGSELPTGTPRQRSRDIGAFLEVLAPSAFPIPGQRHRWRASHGPTACVSRFSQPHDAFIRPEHPSLVSCQSRSWGSPYRALFLATQAAAVSGAVTLLPLEPPAGPRDLGRQSSQLPRICANAHPTPG